MSNVAFPIVYITHARLSSGRAHVLALAKLCEAFVGRGERLEIIAPRYWPNAASEGILPYRVKRPLTVKTLFAFHFLRLGIARRAAFFLQIFLFSVTAVLYALWHYRRKFRSIVFFSHDHLPLYFLSFFTDRIFYDIHHFPGRNFLYRRVMRRARGFAVQTRWKVAALKEHFDISPELIIYWPNGTDVDEFRGALEREAARDELGIGRDEKIALYAGGLLGWKGVGTLIEAVRFLPPDVKVYFVGGSAEEASRLRSALSEKGEQRAVFVAFQPHAMMPRWFKAADVLVLPNTARQRVSLYYTSPMKLFEYMAVGRPIVASRIPSVEEILNEGNAFFAEPDNPASFAQMIGHALTYPEEAGRRARRAAEDVGQYTWANRAAKISEKMHAVFV